MTNEDRPKNRRAAALKYDPQTADAPYVVALGTGYAADKIVETAKENNIHVMRDDKLSEMLHKLSEGDEIPETLYQVVAEVLVFVNSLDEKYGQRFGLTGKR